MKSIKSIIIALCILLLPAISMAQNVIQDVIYLKNGNIIRGVITEQDPAKSLKIETSDRCVFVLNVTDIDRIVKEKASNEDNDDSANSPGYQGLVEIGYGSDNSSLTGNLYKANFINSYKFNSHLSCGLGLGIRNYDIINSSAFPIFIDTRVNFKDAAVSPYLALGIGYTFINDDDYEGGVLISPSAGINIHLGGSVFMNIGLEYSLQHNTLTQIFRFDHDYQIKKISKEPLEYFSFNLGVSF